MRGGRHHRVPLTGDHEWQCPSCGATTRARLADHPDVGDGWAARATTAETYAATVLADLHHLRDQLDRLAVDLRTVENTCEPGYQQACRDTADRLRELLEDR